MISFLLAVSLVGAGNGVSGSVDTAVQDTAPTVDLLASPVVIGASMSYGYGARRGLEFADVMTKALGTKTDIAARSTPMFFMNPIEEGSEQGDFVLDHEASLVIAVDYLFWFGYGAQNADGQLIASPQERLELLELGLDNLDQFDCPIVVGDFPDMSAAVGGMLEPSQMPELSTLPLLNARVHEWADDRNDTIVIPLGHLVQSLNSDQAFRAGRYAVAAGSRKRLIQSDQLHPTLTGLCLLAHVVVNELVESKLIKQDAVDLDLVHLMSTFDLEARGIAALKGSALATGEKG